MYETIIDLINQEEYVKALKAIEHEKQKTETYNDIFAILESEVYYQLKEWDNMFSCIAKGLICNYRNYELYYRLGNYFLEKNPHQAYLCYENACYYCDDDNDQALILQSITALKEEHRLSIPKLSIVILAHNDNSRTQLCLDSLRNTVPESLYELIVVNYTSTNNIAEELSGQNRITFIHNTRDAIFSKCCNQGIKAANPYHDILLLNNDTIILPNSIFWLRMGLYENKTVGAAGSVSNCIENQQQIAETFETPDECWDYALKHNTPMKLPYEKKLKLSGLALMLKRTALDNAGLFDERFSEIYCAADDLSFRLINTGYQLLLCKNSFLYRFDNADETRITQEKILLRKSNIEILNQKWGFQIGYYCNGREDLIGFIEHSFDSAFRVLEVGCGMGATLGCIQNMYPASKVYGIELEDAIVKIGKHYIPQIEQGNIEVMDLHCPQKYFDYIILGDVLEHLYNPGMVLTKLRKYLKPEGCIIASIPNIMHYSVVLDLLRGNFTYKDSGILDKTHLRFFTLEEIRKLFQDNGYHLVDIKGRDIGQKMGAEDLAMYQALLKIPGISSKVNFEVCQYLVRAVAEKG